MPPRCQRGRDIRGVTLSAAALRIGAKNDQGDVHISIPPNLYSNYDCAGKWSFSLVHSFAAVFALFAASR